MSPRSHGPRGNAVRGAPAPSSGHADSLSTTPVGLAPSRPPRIVEGDGEVAALPVLLRRLNAWRTPSTAIDILHPIRVRRDRFLNREREFRRHLLLAAGKCGDDGWIIVLLDADDDCPAELGREILARARQVVPHRRVSVVLANRDGPLYSSIQRGVDRGKQGIQVAQVVLAKLGRVDRE